MPRSMEAIKAAQKRYRQKPEVKAKQNEASKKYQKTEKGKETARRTDYKRLYGITVEEYNTMFIKQSGVCAICKKPSVKILAVDHDHNTGVVRGLLCSNCNTALGLLQDNREIVFNALAYLNGKETHS